MRLGPPEDHRAGPTQSRFPDRATSQMGRSSVRFFTLKGVAKFATDFVFLQLLGQCLSADTHRLRALRSVATVFLENAANVLLFDPRHRLLQGAAYTRHLSSRDEHAIRQVLGLQKLPLIGEQHRTMDLVLELSHLPGPRICFEALEGEPFISRAETSGTQDSLKKLVSQAGYDTRSWQTSMVLGSTQAVISAVESGAGIAFVSNLALERSLAAGTLKRIRVDGVDLARRFYCVYRRDSLSSRLMTEFVDFIRQATPD